MLPILRLRIGIKLLLMVSIVLVSCVGLLAWQAIGLISDFGVRTAQVNETNIRNNTHVMLQRISHEQAKRYDAPFYRIAGTVNLLSTYTMDLIENANLFSRIPLDDLESRLVPDSTHHFLVNRDSEAMKLIYRGARPIKPVVLAMMQSLSLIEPMLIEGIARHSEVVSICVVTEAGFEMHYPRVADMGKEDLRFSAYYKKARDAFAQGMPVVYYDVWETPRRKNPLTMAIGPVYNRAGRFVGMIGMMISLDSILHDLQTARISDSHPAAGHMRMFLADDKGRAIFVPSDLKISFGLGRALIDHGIDPGKDELGLDRETTLGRRLVFLEKDNQQPYTTLALQDGPSLIVAWSNMPTTQWRVGITLSEASILASVQEIQKNVAAAVGTLKIRFAVLSFLFLTAAVLFLLYSLHRLIRPLQALVDAAHRIKDKDFSIRVKHRRGDEIGYVTEAFNAMLDSLDDNYKAIQEKSSALEKEINERKRIEERLAASERQLLSVLDNISDIIWLKDANGVHLMVNDAFAKLCGRSKEAVVGCRDIDLWPRKLAEKYMNDDRFILNTGERCHLEETVVDGEGKEHWVETIKTPVFDHHGKAIGTTGAARDISYRKQYEKRINSLNKELENRIQLRTAELTKANEALKKENAERIKTEKKLQKHRAVLQTIFDGISEPLIFLDKSYQIKILNQAARAYYQMADDTVYLNQFCYELLRNRKTPCQDCQVPMVFNDGVPRIYERQGFMKSDRIEKVCVYSLRGEEGGADGCILHIRDITEEKRMEKELVQADKMISLGVLVSGVAHEINNPNNLIMLNTPILMDGWQSVLPILDAYYEENGEFNVGGLPYTEMRHTLPKLLEGIEGGSKRIMRIVQDLKDYARYQPGDVKEEVDLNKSVKNAVSLVSSQIKKVTHHFSVEYDESLPMLTGNRQKLEQVVINLLQNACQALSDFSEQISVRTYMDPRYDMAAIEVKDSGRGIPTGNLARIMDPFFTTKRDTGGTGLGLSVSSKIVQDHGGRIGVHTREGEGTVFTVFLPTKMTGQKVKVLVADDDELIRKLVSTMLQHTGQYLVTTASNGAEACLMLGSDTPRLLILDIKMPDMDGIEVCRQIQKTPSLSNVKVIIITGHHESYEASVLAGMGFTNILPKPFSPKKLMGLIEAVMDDNQAASKKMIEASYGSESIPQ